jgi:hypothetical protein
MTNYTCSISHVNLLQLYHAVLGVTFYCFFYDYWLISFTINEIKMVDIISSKLPSDRLSSYFRRSVFNRLTEYFVHFKIITMTMINNHSDMIDIHFFSITKPGRNYSITHKQLYDHTLYLSFIIVRTSLTH